MVAEKPTVTFYTLLMPHVLSYPSLQHYSFVNTCILFPGRVDPLLINGMTTKATLKGAREETALPATGYRYVAKVKQSQCLPYLGRVAMLDRRPSTSCASVSRSR
jgi:hypothetical protein